MENHLAAPRSCWLVLASNNSVSMDDELYVDTPRGFGCYDVKNVEDLIALIRLLSDRHRFVYRGHADSEWALQTTLERDIPDGYKRVIGLQGCEQAMLAQFKRRAHHHVRQADVPESTDDLEWLALIQHYGGHTRLLDFTDSIFVAAHFAVGTRNHSNSAAIWAINHHYMSQNWGQKLQEHRQQFADLQPENLTIGELVSATIRRQIAFPAAIEVAPFRQNRRLLRQQGLFIVPVDINRPFVDNLLAMFRPSIELHECDPRPLSDLTAPDEHAILKLRIQRGRYPLFRKDLRQMNISTESLFPDLEGEAKALTDIVTDHVFVK